MVRQDIELVAGWRWSLCLRLFQHSRSDRIWGGEFRAKTLTGDIEDIELVRAVLLQLYPNARRLFLCGMSTGAFLALASGARPAPKAGIPINP
eukprot:SAG31_NODE_13851_length_842_cov_1.411844_1_plen_92_part_10